MTLFRIHDLLELLKTTFVMIYRFLGVWRASLETEPRVGETLWGKRVILQREGSVGEQQRVYTVRASHDRLKSRLHVDSQDRNTQIPTCLWREWLCTRSARCQFCVQSMAALTTHAS